MNQIWAFHGAMDEIVPVEESRIMVEAIRGAGNSQLRYTEYPKGGHNLPAQNWRPNCTCFKKWPTN